MPNDSSDTTDDDNETIGNLERSSHSAEEQPDVTDGMSDEDRTDTNIGSYAEPDGNIGADLDTAKVRDFFEKKGAVEILAQLADGSKRFSEIDEALVVSHGTIATRLTDGAKLGLWREFMTYPDDGGKSNCTNWCLARSTSLHSQKTRTLVKPPNNYDKHTNSTQTPLQISETRSSQRTQRHSSPPLTVANFTDSNTPTAMLPGQRSVRG